MPKINQALALQIAEAQKNLEAAEARIAELEAALAMRASDDSPQPQSSSTSMVMGRYDLFDSLIEGRQILDFDWRYVYLNDAAARHGLLPKASLMGYTIMEKFPGIENTELFAVMRRCMDERTAMLFENRFVYANGTEAWFELNIQPVPEGIFILSFDITERKRSSEALQRYAQRLEMLHKIDLGILQEDSISELVQSTLKLLRQLIPCQRVEVSLFDLSANEALLFAIDPKLDTEVCGVMRIPLPLNYFESFDSRHLQLYDDFHQLEDIQYPNVQEMVGKGFLSAASALLIERDQPIGILTLLADKLGFFTPEYQDIIVEVARQLAIAVQQMRLSDQIKLNTARFEQNVSERTAELQAENRQLRFYVSLQDSVSDSIIVTDLDFRIQSWNRAAERIYGWSAQEAVGKLVPEVLRTRFDGTEDSEIPITLFFEQGWWQGEVVQFHRDGTPIHILGSVTLIRDEQGAPIGVISINHDINARKRAEAELEQNRSFLQNVINVSPSMIFVKDYNARFVLVNPMVAQAYNTTVEALIGKSDVDFNPSLEEAENFLKADRQVIATGKPLFIEEPITNPAGETRWLQTTKVRIVSADGQASYVLGVSTDITERRNAERQLRQALEKEKELGELKSRFISMASHEFRTPLASILALIETLSAYRHTFTDEQIEGRFVRIKHQIDHLKAIMDDVLLIARMQARRFEYVPVLLDLDSLCRSVLDEFISQPGMTHVIDYYCDPALKQVMLDKKLVRQIISNLISNSLKYSPSGSTVGLHMEVDKGSIVLKVSDQGIGIPETDQEHLFEAFHRASNVGTISGAGLGLTIIKESVDLHKGTITIESQVNKGTTIYVRLPLYDAEGNHDGKDSVY